MTLWDLLKWVFEKLLSIAEYQYKPVYAYPHPDALPTMTPVVVQTVQNVVPAASSLTDAALLGLSGVFALVGIIILAVIIAIVIIVFVIYPAVWLLEFFS